MCLEWIALNSVNGLGPVRIKHLLDIYGTPRAVFDEKADRLVRVRGIPEQVVKNIAAPGLLDDAGKQLAAARDAGVTVLTLSDERYPPLLRQIFAPPPVLFIKGRLDLFERNWLAVVGTRVPTVYGQKAVASLTEQLAAAGISIVSGLARGIDTIAHAGCLDKNIPTIAVLGHGIDRIYPSSNIRLAERIVGNGALISEFPIGASPEAFNFPRRNRIISGLSAGVLVVEAGVRSGALITANYALQQGRDVFAVPGSIFSEKSDGTFNLIKNGAFPVRSSQDVLEVLQTIKHALATPVSSTMRVAFPIELLNQQELAVYEIISDDPMRLDQLTEATGTGLSELFNVLLSLELKGAIKQIPGQHYIKT